MNWSGIHSFTSLLTSIALKITGTAGAGFLQGVNQSAKPDNADTFAQRLYVDSTGTWSMTDINGTKTQIKAPTSDVAPSNTGTVTLANWLPVIQRLHARNVNTSVAAASYIHGAAVLSTSAYQGACYSPTQNRLYLAPFGQGIATATTWHYVDGNSGNIVAYTHGATTVANFYGGARYSPTNNRIYFIPYSPGGGLSWHYVDCNSGAVVAYSNGIAASVADSGHVGSVYSPTQDRIYFVPSGQSNQSQWVYINCATGAPTLYSHGVTAVASAYSGGAHSPTQNRIYLAPFVQSTATQWHYIDCATGNVVAYSHGVTSSRYYGAAYSPTQERIYFAPYTQGTATQWHYVDCATGNIVAYSHGVTAVSSAYAGAVYHPAHNRIYFVPNTQGTATQWHYVDCTTGSVVAYSHGLTGLDGGTRGGAFLPSLNRIYLAPNALGNTAAWHYIGGTGDTYGLTPSMFGSTILSSTY